MRIVENCESYNRGDARLLTLGVGYDVNSRLLDKLSRWNHGASLYVQPDENLEAVVSRLYNRIQSPVMTDVEIEFLMDGRGDGKPELVNRIYPRETYDLFAGDQLIVVGRYTDGGDVTVRIRGSIAGKSQEFLVPVTFTSRSTDSKYAFVEKLWAMRRVGEIIDEIDLNGQNQELIDELIQLSKQHGIMTPYTAFLAEEESPSDDVSRRELAVEVLDGLSIVSGRGGVRQREGKETYRGATIASSKQLRAYFDVDSGDEVTVDHVKVIGNRAFFQRGDRWIDATLEEAEAETAEVVERYSDLYFALVRRYGKELGQYLAVDEPITLRVGGKVFAF